MAAKNKVPPYPCGQKLSDIRLRRIMSSLRLRECLKIEYRIKGVWSKMILKSGNLFVCEICGFTNPSTKFITLHVQGKKHRSALRRVDQLFHPEYTGPKGLTVFEAPQERIASAAQNMRVMSDPQKLKAVAKKTSAAEKTKLVTNANLHMSMPYDAEGTNEKQFENGDIKEANAGKPTPAATPVNDEGGKNFAKLVVLDYDDDEKDSETQTLSNLINPGTAKSHKAQKRNALTDPLQKLTAKKQNLSAIKAQQKCTNKKQFFTTKTPNDVEGVIGVEYIVKILKAHNDPNPLYECRLCEVAKDGVGMQAHLLNYKHRYNYLEKHFPTCLNKFKTHVDNIQVMGTILDHVARAIEAHHGRVLPKEFLSAEFDSSRFKVKTPFSEYFGPSFTNVVDEEQIKGFYMQGNVYIPPKLNRIRKPTFDTCNRGREARRARNERRAQAWALGRDHNRSLSPLRKGDLWQAYRHLVDRSVTELNQIYRGYRKNPEKHPLYEEDWRKFWKYRKEQMIREGLDYTNYNFQPEWVRYFAVRIEELYDEALENIKVTSRRRLVLPMTNDNLEDKKYHVEVQHDEQEVEMSEHLFEITENEPAVVNVLRLLAALEEYLGSLGPKVVSLLSKALLVEKSNPRDINKIVLNRENSTILETAMEKLRGVLMAGLLEGAKVRVFNNVISETEKILKIAYEGNLETQVDLPRKKSYFGFIGGSYKRSSTSAGLTDPNECGSGMGVGCSGSVESFLSQIAKNELASKIAVALPAQGIADFNPEQLHQLIAAYSLIKKSENQNKEKTLTALQNPDEKSTGGVIFGGQPSSRQIGATFSSDSYNSSVSLGESSIRDFVSMLTTDYSSIDGSDDRGDSHMRQHLQNSVTSTISRSFNSNSVGGNRGENNLADSRSRFRGGGRGSIGGFRQHTIMNFNSVPSSSNCSGNMVSEANNPAFSRIRSNYRYGGRSEERLDCGGDSEAMGISAELEGGFGSGKSSSGFSKSGNTHCFDGGADSSRDASGFTRNYMPICGLSGFSSGYGVSTGGGSFSAVCGFGSSLTPRSALSGCISGAGLADGTREIQGSSCIRYGNVISKLNRRDFRIAANSSTSFENPSNKNTFRRNNDNSFCFPKQNNTGGNEQSQPMNRNSFGGGNGFQSGSRGTPNWRNQ